MKLKTGIVGCGKVADFHANALRKLPESDFTAVCGHTIQKTQQYADRYGVKAYTDLEKMIRENHLDMICVCTPHSVHADNAVTAAKLGCHVLIEKPMALTLKDCDRIVDAGHHFGVKIGTLFQRRFYSPCMRIKKAIEDGKLGTPIIGTVNMFGWRDEAYYKSDPWRGTVWGEGGGVLPTQATHQLDLLLWYLGDAEEVYGVSRNYNHPYIEVEDTAIAVVKFKNGATGSIVASNSQNPALYGKVAVYGSNGASVGVQTDGGAMFIAGMSSILEPPYNDIWTIPGEADNLEKMKQEDSNHFNSVDHMYYHQLAIRDFLTAVIENRDPLVTAEAGRKSVELFTAIYESSRTGQPVKLVR